MGLACSPKVGAELALPAEPGGRLGERALHGQHNLSCLQKSCIMFCQRDPVTHQVSEAFLSLT